MKHRFIFVPAVILLLSCTAGCNYFGISVITEPSSYEPLAVSSSPIISDSPIESTELDTKIAPQITLIPMFPNTPSVEPSIAPESEEPLGSINTTGKNYFTASEASFNGIEVYKTTVDQMIKILGEPDKIENRDNGYPETIYFFDHVQYIAPGKSNRISTIVITEQTEVDSPRNIKIGDNLENVMSQFPYEQDPEKNGDALFYGTWDGQKGSLYEEILQDGTVIKEIIVTSELIDPFVIIKFKDDLVYEIVITVRTD